MFNATNWQGKRVKTWSTLWSTRQIIITIQYWDSWVQLHWLCGLKYFPYPEYALNSESKFYANGWITRTARVCCVRFPDVRREDVKACHPGNNTRLLGQLIDACCCCCCCWCCISAPYYLVDVIRNWVIADTCTQTKTWNLLANRIKKIN